MEYDILKDETIPKDIVHAVVNNKPVMVRINWPETLIGKKDVDLKLNIEFMYKILYIKRKYNVKDMNLFIFADAVFLDDPKLEDFRKDLKNNFKCVKNNIKKSSDGLVVDFGIDPDIKVSMSLWKGI